MGLKWLGTKKWLIEHLHPMEQCMELFAGSAAVSFALAEQCFLNDTCPPLMEFYRDLRADKVKTLRSAENTFNTVQTSADPKVAFYKLRTNFNAGINRDSASFIAILYAGFNGLWRQGKQGCSTPYGGPRKFPLSSLEEIPIHKTVSLTELSWEQCIPPNDDCVILADPPYAGTFVGYSHSGWQVSDNRKLFTHLANLPNPVLITCLDTPDNVELLRELGFNTINFGRKYRNGAASPGVSVQEILACNARGQAYIK